MIRKFYYMQKSDRKTVLALLIVIVIGFGIIFLTGGEKDENVVSSKDSIAIQKQHKTPTYYVAPKKVELFAFDPNTADSSQLLRLGLQPWQVRNIYKYRASGGVYRKPEDFARLYGLTVKQYRELQPYIRISSDYLPASTLLENGSKSNLKDSKEYVDGTRNYHKQEKIREGEVVILNTADTTTLKMVPGIGPYFARKIVQYGEHLGGYVSTDQLDEIENFPQEAKRYLVVEQPQVRKLNVNQLSLNELKRHPYINYFQAKAILDYRRLHGPLKSLQELRLQKDFPPAAIARLLPYVAY